MSVPWPLPALMAWGLSWCVFALAVHHGLSYDVALAVACATGVLLSLWGNAWWRRALIAVGFPVSLLLVLPQWGAYMVPGWTWLLPLTLLLLVYPINAWRDAPLFPTPLDALTPLPQHAPLPVGAKVLDMGCGLGHGLQALRLAYPQAVLYGLESSLPLRLLCALRCPWAKVHKGDMWQADWSAYDLVYLFQRPESMARAAEKALDELRPGAWMVSLEFEVTQLIATAHYRTPGGKTVWLYQAVDTGYT